MSCLRNLKNRACFRFNLLYNKKIRLFVNDVPVANKHYDLVVIGGGSGGLACSKEAAVLGKRVVVFDYVEPSPIGTKWGLGGTCVNVGCIPKKLFHQASLLGHGIKDSREFGWNVPENRTNNWESLQAEISNHVRSLNWGHRMQLKDKDVEYKNARASLLSAHEIVAVEAGKTVKYTADNVVIATGMRPRYPDNVPGAKKYSITSDDIFWRRTPPGKTLCIGASYVALETAGFLTGLGYDTSVLVRTAVLSKFDQQMAKLVVAAMEELGTRFIFGVLPTKITKESSKGRLNVSWMSKDGKNQFSEEFDTVYFAIGRFPSTSGMGLDKVKVDVDDAGFICGDHDGDLERTSVPNIYAIGDVLKDREELTPVAIKAGQLLARRLFGGSTVQMDYANVASTVFTPIEYSFVGLSEEQAYRLHGDNAYEVYHAFFKPLEFTVSKRNAEHCYIKAIVEKPPSGKVLGLHYHGPNAGEVMQGYAVAMRCGMTFEQLSSTVGIHPTCSEEVVKLRITKSSGVDPHVTGC